MLYSHELSFISQKNMPKAINLLKSFCLQDGIDVSMHSNNTAAMQVSYENIITSKSSSA